MIEDTHTETVAAVCGKGDTGKLDSSAATMRTYLEAHGMASATWFDPLDLGKLDEAVHDGRIQHVVFGNVAALLEGIWDGEITFDDWLRAGVRLDFVESPDGTSEATIQTVFESWQRWNRRHRRRQTIAGIVVSAIALAAGFVLNTIMP